MWDRSPPPWSRGPRITVSKAYCFIAFHCVSVLFFAFPFLSDCFSFALSSLFIAFSMFSLLFHSFLIEKALKSNLATTTTWGVQDCGLQGIMFHCVSLRLSIVLCFSVSFPLLFICSLMVSSFFKFSLLFHSFLIEKVLKSNLATATTWGAEGYHSDPATATTSGDSANS